MTAYKRRLPHFHPEDSSLFVTWRLHDTLPFPKPEILTATPGRIFVAEDRALARAAGPSWLAQPRVAEVVKSTLTSGEHLGQYVLHAWVVMPNHVHLLIDPNATLAAITQWIKGRTSNQVNRLLGRAGQPFWQHESYDHYVRNEREFLKIAAYIEHNPVAAGLVSAPENWSWSSASR